MGCLENTIDRTMGGFVNVWEFKVTKLHGALPIIVAAIPVGLRVAELIVTVASRR